MQSYKTMSVVVNHTSSILKIHILDFPEGQVEFFGVYIAPSVKSSACVNLNLFLEQLKVSHDYLVHPIYKGKSWMNLEEAHISWQNMIISFRVKLE